MKCPFYLLLWAVYALAQSTGFRQENVPCLAKETGQNKREECGGGWAMQAPWRGRLETVCLETQSPPTIPESPLEVPGAAQEMGDGHDSLNWSVPSCPGDNCFWALCHAYPRHSPDLLCADTRSHKRPACCWVCCLLWMF